MTRRLASLATCYARTQRWSTSLGAGGAQAGCGRAPCRVPGRDTARAALSVQDTHPHLHHLSLSARPSTESDQRGLGYSLIVLEHRAMNKDYGERKRSLDAMATKVFPVEQLIFVDECHKSESLFASCRLSWLSSSAKCSAHARTHARTPHSDVLTMDH